MLFPEPPKSVARRRAVAEMTVAVKQAAAIPPGHVLVLPASTTSWPDQVAAPPGTADPPPVTPRRHDTPI